MLSRKKTNCNPLAHSTWKCRHANLWIAKLFHLTEDLLHFFTHWRLVAFFQMLEAVKRASCGLSSMALKRTGCDVWQLECQASNVTTSVQSDHFLCQYMLAVFLDTDHLHSAPPSVLKFSPCRNKPLPQATTRLHQYTHSSCSVPQMQY